jgi:ubiquitin conjugation factor E4 B
VDENEVSTDGFMMNVAVVLDELCEPFMDAGFTRISKIDVDYLRRSPRINIKDETKLNADQTTSDKFYETKLEGTSNFISEVFFLNLASHHYGSEATNTKLKNLEKEIKHFQKQMVLLEAERPKLASVSCVPILIMSWHTHCLPEPNTFGATRITDQKI